MSFNVIKDLSNEFHPVPKHKRIINKTLLKKKKGVCAICGKRGQTEKHHKKSRRSRWRRYRRKFN